MKIYVLRRKNRKKKNLETGGSLTVWHSSASVQQWKTENWRRVKRNEKKKNVKVDTHNLRAVESSENLQASATMVKISSGTFGTADI